MNIRLSIVTLVLILGNLIGQVVYPPFHNQRVFAAAQTSAIHSGRHSTPVITQAMDYLQGRTSAPLWAPISIPTKTDSGIDVDILSAVVIARRNDYEIEIYSSDRNYPVNSPPTRQLQKDFTHNQVAVFGVADYNSQNAAMNAEKNPFIPTEQLQDSSGSAVTFKNRIRAMEYERKGSTDVMLTWSEHNWTFVVDNKPPKVELWYVNSRLIPYLKIHPLPLTDHGQIYIVLGDGQHTQMVWKHKKLMLYSANYRSEFATIEVARNLRPYDKW